MSGSRAGSVGGSGRVEMGMEEALVLLAIHVVAGRSNSSRGYVLSCLLPLLTDRLSQVDKVTS